jgi:hypothetical protein
MSSSRLWRRVGWPHGEIFENDWEKAVSEFPKPMQENMGFSPGSLAVLILSTAVRGRYVFVWRT